MKDFFIQNDIGYSLIPNYIFRDKRLKIKDIGLLTYLLSVNLNDKPSVIKLINEFENDGKDSIRGSIFNLEKCDYLIREKERWILKVDIVEHEYEASNSRLLLYFRTDPIARTQCWTNNELSLLKNSLEKLEDEYEWNIVYPCFKYSISHLPASGINDRVAYIIASLKKGCQGLYFSGLSDEERKKINPKYKTTLESIQEWVNKSKRRDLDIDE